MTTTSFRLGFETLLSETYGTKLGWQGAPPNWLTGSLLRTGPAKFQVGQTSYRHWFDGLAMLHRFELSRSGVLYTNRFLRGETFCAAEKAGAIARDEFATNRPRPFWSRLFGSRSGEVTDNGNVNIAEYGANDFVALTETPHPVRFDASTLKTVGPYTWVDDLNSQMMTAHPHYDSERGLIYNCETLFGRRNFYRFTRMAFGSRSRSVVTEIETDQPAWVHSFGMSAGYLILAEFPMVTEPLRLLFSSRPFIESYRWRPERGLRLTVVDKNSGAIVRRAETHPCFAFHLVNAFEADGAIAIDLVAYADASVVSNFYLDRLRTRGAKATGVLTRIRIPLGSDRATTETLSGVPLEMPRIDYRRRAGCAHHYVWAVGQAHDDFLDRVTKYDLHAGRVVHWSEADCYPGEPVFAAAPNGECEDDGAILSVVLDAAQNRSFLLVLDAATLQERARAWAPHAIPFDFHGEYYPDAARAA